MKKKEIKITEKEQRVAIDILSEFELYMMTHNDWSKELLQVFKSCCQRYNLYEDPFTGTLCTPKEWAKNCLEYDRQIMIERYGHCDGLD